MNAYAYYTFKDFNNRTLCIGYTKNHISSIQLVEKPSISNVTSPLSDLAYTQLKEYFFKQRKVFTLPLFLNGTSFQHDVWNALQQIPYGETRSYKDIAVAIGNPNASRAVGMANHRNPLMILIPCHRVIGTNQKLVGYAYGLDIKKDLLSLENNFNNDVI